MARPMCRHCERKPANRPLGLCWTCYYTPGVRERYPSTSRYARRSPIPAVGGGGSPTPTRHPPGSDEKLAVLEERARLGQDLWHHEDAPAHARAVPERIQRQNNRHDHYERGGDGEP